MGSVWPFLYGYFSLKMVLMLIHVYSWYLGFHWNQCRGISLISSGLGNRCLWHCGTTHEGSCRVSMWDRPPLEVRRELRDSFLDKAEESTLISRWGGAKGLRLSCARKLGVPLEWEWYVGELFELHRGFQVLFRIYEGTWDFSWDPAAGKGLILRWRGNFVVFLELTRDSRVMMGNSGSLWIWRREVQSPFKLQWEPGITLESLQGK